MISQKMVEKINTTLEKDVLTEKLDVSNALRDFSDQEVAKILTEKRLNTLGGLVYELSQTTEDKDVQARLRGYEGIKEFEAHIASVKKRLEEMAVK